MATALPARLPASQPAPNGHAAPGAPGLAQLLGQMPFLAADTPVTMADGRWAVQAGQGALRHVRLGHESAATDGELKPSCI